MAEDDWWFDLKSKTAVQDNRAGRAADRLGPYPSQEAAEQALAKVDERNAAYDADPDWKDD